MKEPWEKAYVYGRIWLRAKTAHIVPNRFYQPPTSLCGLATLQQSRTPKPYPVCKNCLGTKRAKELGL